MKKPARPLAAICEPVFKPVANARSRGPAMNHRGHSSCAGDLQEKPCWRVSRGQIGVPGRATLRDSPDRVAPDLWPSISYGASGPGEAASKLWQSLSPQSVALRYAATRRWLAHETGKDTGRMAGRHTMGVAQPSGLAGRAGLGRCGAAATPVRWARVLLPTAAGARGGCGHVRVRPRDRARILPTS